VFERCVTVPASRNRREFLTAMSTKITLGHNSVKLCVGQMDLLQSACPATAEINCTWRIKKPGAAQV